MKYLKLQMKGVLQHYSALEQIAVANSSIYYRTERCPTKQAVIGMIGAVMGIQRKSDDLIDLYDSLSVHYKTIHKGSTVVDYQTVGPLYDGDTFSKVGGGLASKKESMLIKNVEYLQDYEFAVYISGEADLIDRIFAAFNDPVYPPYFGKRSCIPCKPIVTMGSFVTKEDFDHAYECP